MGRGRQKAKNTKVARELKYFSPNTDLNALEREIGSTTNDEPDYEDKWADLYQDDAEAAATTEGSATTEPTAETTGETPAEAGTSDPGSSDSGSSD